MKQAGTSLLVCLVAIVVYFLAWPVPVDPVAWQAPQDRGLVEPFAPNDQLAPARRIALGADEGPEDIALGPDGYLYTGTADGNVIRMRPDGRSLEVFAVVGGRPLGLEFDRRGNLLVANAHLGLQQIAPDGAISVLVDKIDDLPLVYLNDLAVADDGKIYASESSAKFGALEMGGTYEASLLDIIEHGGHGRVFEFDRETESLRILLSGLNFANGVAISEDQSVLLIAESAAYQILAHRLRGPRAGTTSVLLGNLPGFPDNINNGMNGRFWIGFVAPRNALIDKLAGAPALRKMLLRLPRSLRPAALPAAHVVAIDRTGQVLMDLQGQSSGLAFLTGVLETPTALYLSALFGDGLGRLDKRDLATN